MNYLCCRMKPGGPRFKLEFYRGDDRFAPYISLEHWWFGHTIWHCVFFNGWKRREAGR
jgi:hypothetical protein